MGKQRNNDPIDLEERKKITQLYIDDTFKEYPKWNTEKDNLPAIKAPKSVEKGNLNLTKKKIATLDINPLAKSVILGTVIGDSTLNIADSYVNARIQARHSTEQHQWCIWKYLVALKDFMGNNFLFQWPDGYQKEKADAINRAVAEGRIPKPSKPLGKLKVSTNCDKRLTTFHKITNGDDTKSRTKVKRFWLNHMTNYSLMTLWLDDGSLGNKRQGTFSLQSMPFSEKQIFREYLEIMWGIKTVFVDLNYQMTNKEEGIQIYISNQSHLLQFLRIVAPVIPVKEMLYKVCFYSRENMDLTQRWKTELKGLVRPEFSEYVEEHYSNINLFIELEE